MNYNNGHGQTSIKQKIIIKRRAPEIILYTNSRQKGSFLTQKFTNTVNRYQIA